jgi:hypothetical protein
MAHSPRKGFYMDEEGDIEGSYQAKAGDHRLIKYAGVRQVSTITSMYLGRIVS